MDFICSKAGFMKQQKSKQKLVYFRQKKHIQQISFGRTVLKAHPFTQRQKDWVFAAGTETMKKLFMFAGFFSIFH
jgi:hypothetical protein